MDPLTGFWGKLGFRFGGPTQPSNAAGIISGWSILAPWWTPVSLLMMGMLLMFVGPYKAISTEATRTLYSLCL